MFGYKQRKYFPNSSLPWAFSLFAVELSHQWSSKSPCSSVVIDNRQRLSSETTQVLVLQTAEDTGRVIISVLVRKSWKKKLQHLETTAFTFTCIIQQLTEHNSSHVLSKAKSESVYRTFQQFSTCFTIAKRHSSLVYIPCVSTYYVKILISWHILANFVQYMYRKIALCNVLQKNDMAMIFSLFWKHLIMDIL